jgi:hypothetical protein
MKTFKTRDQFYLPDDLSGNLERRSSRPGTSKTAILTEAYRFWLERRAGPDVDKQFGQRLDRMSRGQEGIHGRLDILAEALGVFVHHQLTGRAPAAVRRRAAGARRGALPKVHRDRRAASRQARPPPAARPAGAAG